ncbi:MAG: hypothetical protein OXH49_05385 [Gemmatimonadetes bacterium]|nr:hypothetical protein [Gemmatimonadota bacterium]
MPKLQRTLALGAAVLVAAAWAAPASPPDAGTAHAPSRTTSDETAEALVDAWIEALGGMETYWKLQSASYTLTTEIWDPTSGRLQRTRPRYVTIARLETGQAARIERWEGNDFIQHGFDGVQQWAVMNGETLGPGDKDYDEARYVSGDVFYWIGLPFKLKDPGVFLHYDGTDEDGRHLVRVTFGEGVGDHSDTWFYVFEEGRAMPVSIGYREEGRRNISRTYWEDVREVDGYVFTGRRVHVNTDGRIWKVLVTSDFVLNPEVDPAIFSRP